MRWYMLLVTCMFTIFANTLVNHKETENFGILKSVDKVGNNHVCIYQRTFCKTDNHITYVIIRKYKGYCAWQL